MEMNQITVSDADLRKGAEEGMDAFLKVFIDKYIAISCIFPDLCYLDASI